MDEAGNNFLEFDRQSIIIERAAPVDAEAIMNIRRNAWMSTYVNEGLEITAEDINKRMGDITIGIKNWQRGLATEIDKSERVTFIALIEDEVVGYTSPHVIDGKQRVGALYVSPEFQGKGIGTKLLSQVVAWYGREDDIFLHVLSYNQHAIDFYEKFGFEKTGREIPDEPEHGISLPPEIEMVLRAESIN